MLKKMASLGGLFAHKDGHPLADPRELRQVIGELPKDNAFKALDEIAGWLESIQSVADFPAPRLLDALRQFDEVAAPHLRRLSREYLNTLRLSRAEEKRLWSISYGCWTLLAASYERILTALETGARSADFGRDALPFVCTRLITALGAMLKWEHFHYGPSQKEAWRRLGRALLAAEAGGCASKAVGAGGQVGASSPLQEYLKVMVFQAASMDSLLPLEIELAERLIAHFLPGFVFSAQATHDSVYWVDLALAQPPLRLARMPAQAAPSQRFFRPGAAHAAMQAELELLERGGEIPAEINLGGQYRPRSLIPVLRHLVNYLAPVPPQRRHDRHRVKHRVAVLNGLINAFVVFSPDFGGRPTGLSIESWVVENVSRGGFGTIVNHIPAEWLKVGALLALQPEGGDNWLLGCVRRYHRHSESEAHVGIESLARHVLAVELRAQTASSYAAVAGMPSLLIEDAGEPDDALRVVLPAASFDLREVLEYSRAGERYVLHPVALLEQTADYELARYRRMRAG